MNLLITRHDKIGDFVVTLPLFRVIKTAKPEIKIHALVSKINYDFAKSIDFIDEVILYDKSDFFCTLKRIKNAKIDMSISGFINTQLGLLLFLAGIKKRVGPATKLAQIFFNEKVIQRRSKVEKTEFEYNLDLALKLDLNTKLDFGKPLINIDGSEVIKKFRNDYSIESSKKIVAFHPGYGGSSDGNISLDDYVKLAKKTSLNEDAQVVFTFGPNDLEVKKELESKIDFKVILYESKGAIIDFCKLLSGFNLFISTSTGPMHLAGCVNTKTISFFGDSLFASSKRWATVSTHENQNNFIVGTNYSKELYLEIENRLMEELND